MKRRLPELLAPAGTYEALVAAVAAGADAVYTGAGALNARAGARDLTAEELRRASSLAHAHGARVYVTLNVYVRDGELDVACDLARRVLDAGADALIVADAGLVRELRRRIPGVEIHLSTQAGVHAPAGAVLAARELGVGRVTCGRELSVPEIAAMAATGVEIEAFCHGAICISYAGACAFSALRRGRSANRGDCTQPCRLHYALEDGAGARVDAREGDMLLCPRDYLSVRHLYALVRSGVSALKIEGRMKNPDYVYNVVACYREALDALAAGGSPDAGELESRLARSFNRGFSTEYLDGRSGAALMSWERSCNQGAAVGRVAERRYEEVVVELDRPVFEGDTLEIRYIPGADAPADVPKRWPMVPCPADAPAGARLAVRCKRKVDAGSVVHVVRSAREVERAVRAIGELDPRAGERAVPGRSDSGRSNRAEAPREALPAAAPAPEPAAAPATAPAPAAAPARIILVEDPAAASRALELARAGLDSVAVRAELLLESGSEAWDGLVPRMTVVLEEVSRAVDEQRQRELCRRAAAVVCRNPSQIAYAREEGAAFEVAAPITVSNAATARAMAELGARRAWLPDELSVDAACELARAARGVLPLAVRALGRPVLMTCEHCLLTAEGPCKERCAACPRRLAPRFLVDRDGERLPVRVDALGRTRVLDARPLDRAGDEARLAACGVSAFVVEA